MQLIINVPDVVYNMVMNTGTYGMYRFNSTKAIKNGKPLPKGHGRLIDADKVISDGVDKGFCDWYDELKYADTIIEADTESEDKE